MPGCGGSRPAFSRARRSSSGAPSGPPVEPALLGPCSARLRVICAECAAPRHPCAARCQWRHVVRGEYAVRRQQPARRVVLEALHVARREALERRVLSGYVAWLLLAAFLAAHLDTGVFRG